MVAGGTRSMRAPPRPLGDEDGDGEVAVTASSMGSSLLSATAFLAVGWEEVLDLASKLSQLRITMASPRAAWSPLWLRTNPLSMQARGRCRRLGGEARRGRRCRWREVHAGEAGGGEGRAQGTAAAAGRRQAEASGEIRSERRRA